MTILWHDVVVWRFSAKPGGEGGGRRAEMGPRFRADNIREENDVEDHYSHLGKVKRFFFFVFVRISSCRALIIVLFFYRLPVALKRREERTMAADSKTWRRCYSGLDSRGA